MGKRKLLLWLSKNDLKDIEGKRIFLAMDCDKILGYLFGHKEIAEENTSVYKTGEQYFEIDEIYVCPQYRNQGIGKSLFKYVENEVSGEFNILKLTTATKNFRAILHFYIDELGMEFWSALLFKKVRKFQFNGETDVVLFQPIKSL